MTFGAAGLGAKREPGGRIQTDTCRGTKNFSQVAEHRVDPVHYLLVKLQSTYSIDAPRIAFKGISFLKTFFSRSAGTRKDQSSKASVKHPV